MAAIVTDKFRTQSALNFFNAFSTPSSIDGSTNTDDIIPWFAVAQSTSWGAGAPNPSNGDVATFLTEINAIKRIDRSNFAFVYARVDWTSGDTYSADDVVINSDFFVYKCTTAGGGTSTIEPNSTTPTTGADGYVWEFLFDVPSNMMSDFATSSWFPIPYGSTETNNQKTDGSYKEIYELEAKTIMLNVSIFDSDTSFVDGVIIRKIGIITDILDGSGNKLFGTHYSSVDIDNDSGNCIWLDFVDDITQSANTVDNFKAIIVF